MKRKWQGNGSEGDGRLSEIEGMEVRNYCQIWEKNLFSIKSKKIIKADQLVSSYSYVFAEYIYIFIYIHIYIYNIPVFKI